MAEVAEKQVPKKIEPKKVKLTIHSTDDDKSDVVLAHNHRHVLIQRDQPVVLEEYFVTECLRPIETTVKGEDGQIRAVKIQRHSYSVEPV